MDRTRSDSNPNMAEVLDVAAQAGHVLLENGAEISRVEETMERISSNFGTSSRNFFVLSNGIFTTGESGAESYAKVEFIPLKGGQMEKIVEINRLSRDIEAGKYTLPEARTKVEEIRTMPAKPRWEQLLGSAFGSAGFCILFGGGFFDAAASFVVGLLLWALVLCISRPGFSKVLVNIIGGAFATLLCIFFHRIGLGSNLGNMMVGSLIPLIPGVPFTNGIRDIANEDYIAGATRLMDALLVFLGISVGVCIVFLLYGYIGGSQIELHGSVADPLTANVPIQTVAAFIGTIGFAVLFGVPRNQYLACGIVAAAGWAIYYSVQTYTPLSAVENTFITSVFVALVSRAAAVIRKCPVIIFLICGLFPMIPGAGVFWTTYYVTSRQLGASLTSGLSAVSVTLAIVFAILTVSGLPRIRRKRRKTA